ncbi:hypothetical protein PHLGIDRAFT_26578 [Phlebiopsis gigantea 11061_1 CR5-6]|uniref:NAD(P)-binding protein n=1 Tax=Phlebiopsis gigantea (strain 11061_1 CR5-6) TaxID=745531 RepID=A0A0C3S0F7_PHLG1|nr:hypothetical protein PHLGIDRAFT_26578 [Phlebiopsis gigantea 11061_1 CR5-6]
MGNTWSLVAQMYPPKPQWGVDDIPSLTGKVAVVTDKSRRAIQELKDDTGREALFLLLDLADLRDVKRAAAELLTKEPKIHILINNAGVMYCPIAETTAQGYDMQFGTNVVGHWYFTERLMPALLAVAADDPSEKARVVTTSSSANYLATLTWDSFVDGPKRRAMGTTELYNQSKHGNVVVAREMARRYGHRGIVSTSVNPGNLSTELQRYLTGMKKWAVSQILYPASFGALTQLYAATAPEAADMNGQFLIPWARVGKARAETGDPAVGTRLWEWLESECQKI